MLRVCQSFEMIQVDAAVVPPVQGQPGPPATVRLGVQPGEPPASTGAAPTRADMDADDAAGEADQDRGQGRPPCQGRHVPAGGGGGCLGRCSRRSWCGSVACERRRASGDHSSGVDGSGVEPRRTGMVRREVRATGRGTSRSGPSGRSDGHPACRPPQSHRFSLDKRMRSASNACSAEAGEVPDNQVNAHLGNPGREVRATGH